MEQQEISRTPIGFLVPRLESAFPQESFSEKNEMVFTCQDLDDGKLISLSIITSSSVQLTKLGTIYLYLYLHILIT